MNHGWRREDDKKRLKEHNNAMAGQWDEIYINMQIALVY